MATAFHNTAIGSRASEPAILTGFPSWSVLNNCGCGVSAAVRRKPSLTRPPDVLSPTMGTFRARRTYWKVGKSSRITLDAGRESAISVRARDHYNAHVSALRRATPMVILPPIRRSAQDASVANAKAAPTLAFANVRSGPLLLTPRRRAFPEWREPA